MGSERIDLLERLKERARSRQLRVAVIGLGYVGLPLAVRFAEAGYTVVGVEVDPAKVEAINAGRSYIADVSDAALAAAVQGGRLKATLDTAALATVDAMSVCVPTPLSKFRDPDLGAVLAVSREIQKHLAPGQLVVLESTTYPGTTEEVLLPIVAARGLTAGVDVFIAFSPERIDPGRADFTVKNTPRVVGGATTACTEAVVAVYGGALDRVVPVSSPRAAEMAKLLENTFRSVNIALVNEIALMCDRLGIPVFEVIRAAATKPFGFMPFWPGPGIGGHCLPIDPLYLSWKMRSLDYRARFIEVAEEINRSMPLYVVNKVFSALNRHGKPVKGSGVLVLGVAYKKNVDDVRESPAVDVIHHLQTQHARLMYHDPFVPHFQHGDIDMHSVPLDAATLSRTDCAVIVTDHSCIDWKSVVASVPVIVDTRNVTEGLRHLGDVVTL